MSPSFQSQNMIVFVLKLSSSIKKYNPNKIEQTEKKGESQVAGYSTVLASICVVKGKKKINSNTLLQFWDG